jgi:16S rRNA (cytidine1402-2'-O)-methyltransferase
MASGLTLENASIQSRCAKDWKKLDTAPDNRTPVVFAIGQ